MPKYKPVIEIDKNNIDNLRIVNGLKAKREYFIKNLDDNKRALLVKIGRNTRKIPDIEHPVIWHSPTNRNRERYLKLPPQIEIAEPHETNRTIIYPIKRRKII